MSFDRRKWRRFLGAGVAISSIGCANTRMQKIESAPEFHVSQIHKALVVGLSKDDSVRQLFEDELVKQWTPRGVTVVPSLAVLPKGTALDKAGIEPYAKSGGFDVVLVTRPLERQPIDRQVRVQDLSQGTPTLAPEDDSNMTNYFTAVVASPQYDIPYEVAFVRTNIYAVSTEKRLWSGMTQTLLTGDIHKEIAPFIKVILKNLYQD
jgi:hypothetical protein